MTLPDGFLTILDMQLVRGSALTGFAALVAAYGGDPDERLSLAGIDPADAGDDDRFIPLRSAIAAVEESAVVLGVPDFGRHPAVINGCSELFRELWGDDGVGVRSAVGMGSLPGNIAVEIEAIVEIRDA